MTTKVGQWVNRMFETETWKHVVVNEIKPLSRWSNASSMLDGKNVLNGFWPKTANITVLLTSRHPLGSKPLTK